MRCSDAVFAVKNDLIVPWYVCGAHVQRSSVGRFLAFVPGGCRFKVESEEDAKALGVTSPFYTVDVSRMGFCCVSCFTHTPPGARLLAIILISFCLLLVNSSTSFSSTRKPQPSCDACWAMADMDEETPHHPCRVLENSRRLFLDKLLPFAVCHSTSEYVFAMRSTPLKDCWYSTLEKHPQGS